MDFGKIMDTLLIIVLLPSLLNIMTSLTGTTLSGVEEILNVFTSLLPIILLFNIFSDLFSGVSKGFGKFFDMLLMVMIIPTLVNTLGSIAGIDTSSIQSVVDVLIQLLPIMAIFELFEGLFKR